MCLWDIYRVYKPTLYGYMHQEYTQCIEYTLRVHEDVKTYPEQTYLRPVRADGDAGTAPRFRAQH